MRVYRSYNGGGNILGGSQFRRFTDYHGLRGTNFPEAIVAGDNNNDFITGGMFWSRLQKSAHPFLKILHDAADGEGTCRKNRSRKSDVAQAGVQASMSYCINRAVSIISDPFAPMRTRFGLILKITERTKSIPSIYHIPTRTTRSLRVAFCRVPSRINRNHPINQSSTRSF